MDDYRIIIMLALIAVAGGLITYIILRNRRKTASGSKLKINMGGEKQTEEKLGKISENPGENYGQSLDELYAEKHAMWICPRCETLNEENSECCIACGFCNKEDSGIPLVYVYTEIEK